MVRMASKLQHVFCMGLAAYGLGCVPPARVPPQPENTPGAMRAETLSVPAQGAPAGAPTPAAPSSAPASPGATSLSATAPAAPGASSTLPAGAAVAPPGAAPNTTVVGTGPAATSTGPATAGPPRPPGLLECVEPPDPEFDEQSPWAKELGQRLSQALPSLVHCTRDVPSGDAREVTLRLVYARDGAPISQHIVSSTPESCGVAECVKAELAKIRSPRLIIDRASYDVALVLERGKVPKQASEPPPPLVSEEPTPGSCVDAEVAQLSERRVREVVSTSYPALKQCYAQALSRNHSATGNVTFEFVIGHAGEVDSAQARAATLYDCEAIRCMLTQFKGLRFPAPVGRSVRVIYPINYTVEQSPVTLR